MIKVIKILCVLIIIGLFSIGGSECKKNKTKAAKVASSANDSTPIETVPTFGDWSVITAGYGHSLGISSDGTLWAWGANSSGQLGLGDFYSRDVPVRVGIDSDWSLIAAGGDFTIAIKTDKTLWTCGQNWGGQLGQGDGYPSISPNLTRVGSDSDWSIAAGGRIHMLALKTNPAGGGTLWACGLDYDEGLLGTGTWASSNVLIQVGTDSDWLTIAVGDMHSIGLRTDGTIWTWGNNSYGQIGDPGISNQGIPNKIGTDSDWVKIAAGHYFTCALKSNNTLWTWGQNSFGQLGLVDIDPTNTPNPVGTESDWLDVKAGESHTIGLKSNGTLFGWGYNSFGQLGIGDTVNRPTPAQIGGGTNWIAIAARGKHNVSLKSDGTIWSWGYNDNGQLGLADKSINRNTPTQIISGMPQSPLVITSTLASQSQINIYWSDDSDNETGFIVQRKSGRAGTYAQIAQLAANTTLYSDTDITFSNQYYYTILAYNEIGTSGYFAETTMALSGVWSDLAVGDSYTIAFKTNGTIWSWGYNLNGQLGQNDTVTRDNPTAIGTDSDWSKIRLSGSSRHIIARKSNNTIWAWGYNYCGQLGLGNTIDRYTPTSIDASSDWSAIATGWYHSIIRKSNGTLWACGWNGHGQLGLNDSVTRYTPTPIGTSSDWLISAGGNYHSVAIKTNNTIWSWGRNEYGSLGFNDTTNRPTPTAIGTNSDWVMVAAEYDQTIARKTNNTLWAWGYNNRGQLGLNDITNRYTPTPIGTDSDWSVFACGGQSTVACKINGTLWAWGYNQYGQLGLGDNSDRYKPTQVGTETNWSVIAFGSYAFCVGLKNNNTLWVWGANGYRQLGFGDTIDRWMPTMLGD